MLDSRFVRLALGLLLVVVTTACGAAEDSGSEAVADSNAAPAAASTDSADPVAVRGSKPPLPAAVSADGDLPRSYGGWSLGDPAPDIEAKGEDARYPGASIHCKPLDERPKTRLCAYVDQDTIFRIEWRSRTDSLEVDDVAESFVPILGEPSDEGNVVRYTTWNDGLSEGSTTWIVNRLSGSDWIRVGVEDTHRGGKIAGWL